MHKFEEKKLSNDFYYKGKTIKIYKDTVELPNGRQTIREIVRHIPAVGILAVSDDDKIILVRQYRYAIDKTILEIPAGKIDEGEEAVQCAFREFEEETGYAASRMDHIVTFYTSPGTSNGQISLYRAGGISVGTGGLDDDEFLEIVELSREEVKKALADGHICDVKTHMAIQAWLFPDIY